MGAEPAQFDGVKDCVAVFIARVVGDKLGRYNVTV